MLAAVLGGSPAFPSGSAGIETEEQVSFLSVYTIGARFCVERRNLRTVWGSLSEVVDWAPPYVVVSSRECVLSLPKRNTSVSVTCCEISFQLLLCFLSDVQVDLLGGPLKYFVVD